MLVLSVRVSLVGVGSLDGLGGRPRVLGLLDSGLPVVEGVAIEDHIAVLLARRTAFSYDVPERRRRLEEPQLRLEVLLTVHLRGHRPEGIGTVHEHLGWQGVYAVLPDLKLPVGGRPEGEVAPDVPSRGVLPEYSGRYAHHRDALVVPRPAHVREMSLEP